VLVTTIPSGEIAGISLDFDTSGFTIVGYRDVPGRNVVALIDDDQPCLAERTIRHVAEPVLILSKMGMTKPMPKNKAETVKIESALTGYSESVMAKEYDLTIGMHSKDCKFDAQSLATSFPEIGRPPQVKIGHRPRF